MAFSGIIYRARRAWLWLRFGGKRAFIRRYCQRSKITWDRLRQHRVVERCDCGDETCEGWAMIPLEEGKRLEQP